MWTHWGLWQGYTSWVRGLHINRLWLATYCIGLSTICIVLAMTGPQQAGGQIQTLHGGKYSAASDSQLPVNHLGNPILRLLNQPSSPGLG